MPDGDVRREIERVKQFYQRVESRINIIRGKQTGYDFAFRPHSCSRLLLTYMLVLAYSIEGLHEL
jgi:hypothetical protein